jgi:suppressor of G2 allele of SKP1
MFDEWIAKCKKELPPPPTTEVKPTTETNTAPVQPAIKHDWYQTESTVTITILAKNVDPTDVSIITKEDQLVIKTNNPQKINFNRDFNLSHAIIPDQTQIKHLSTKVSFEFFVIFT